MSKSIPEQLADCRKIIVKLESALAAEQEARKLAESLTSDSAKHWWKLCGEVTGQLAYTRMELAKALQRAEAAEALIKASRDENAQLTAELHSMNINFSGMLEDRNKYKRENAELQRQLEEASKDAARYKWLRNNTKGFASFHLFAYNSTLPDDMFDCAVDSAMISAAPTTDQPKE